jgi:hypothetical protein
VVSNGLIIANNITAFSNLGSFGASFNNSYSGVKAGITLTGANVFNSNKYNGLSVYSNGTIQLSNITANSNDTAGQPLFYGADVRNATGAPTSNVVLTGINVFNDNYYDGLFINSAGAVTASSITANHQQWGAGITAAGAVTLTGSNTFNSNQVDGLDVFSSGAITTNNLTANENGQNGVYLDNCRSSSGCTVSSAQPVTLNGFNAFNSNVREGLVIYSKGAVKTNNLTADCNGFNAGCGSTGSFGYGVWIDNCRIYSGSCTGNGAVTVAGTNVFNGNYTGGLYIQSRGAITLNSITASFNAQGFGLNADNTFSGPGSPQTITLSGVSVFDGNNTWGAALSGYGKITASNVTARWNGLTGSTPGVSLNNYNGDSTTRPPAAIALSGVNSFIGNYGDGLDISATGAINVSNAASTGSVNGYGAVLTNNYFPGPQSVTMTALTASNNYYGGLLVSSHGAISGLNLTASGNDTSHSLSSYGADFSTDGSSLTLTGANVFNNNYWTNFHASALGAVTISNLQASGSVAGQGANISNGNASTASALSLTGSSVFWNNYLDGLYVFNFGPITANNLTASGNGAGGAHGVGAYLWNASASAPQKVTVTGVNTFNNNYYGGLAVSSLGPVAVSNVTASSNTHGSGVNITNSFSAAYGGVTLSGTNVANDNASRYGFEIYSAGAITLNNVTANGNTDGALLENDNYGSAGIAITGMNSFNNNSMNGMETYTKGSITLSQSAFDENTGTGLFVHNGSFNAFTVTMLCGSFTGNASGLALSSPATPITAIYLTGVVFSGNTTTNTLIGTTPLTQVRNCPLP